MTIKHEGPEHEIRNALSVIVPNLEDLLDVDCAGDPRVADALEAAQRIVAVVDKGKIVYFDPREYAERIATQIADVACDLGMPRDRTADLFDFVHAALRARP